jgi:hypothetical protein
MYFSDFLATLQEIAHLQKLKPNQTLLMRDSGFRRETDKNCTLLRFYAASIDNSLPMFRDNLSVPSSRIKILAFEDGTDRLSRNFGQELPLLAV